MKKILLSILTILYMGVSSGIAMDIHYCMGKVAQVDLYGKEESKCAKCKADNTMPCCGEQLKFYKLSNAHQSAYNNLSFAAVITTVLIPFPTYNWQYNSGISHKAVANNSPPIYSAAAIRILHCSFRI